MQALRA